uniref:Protein kinase domain-containing protein n=1 Tax=Timema genevievae TaxID=629358 RepID=A0A7R9PQU6_TIMGE|nr:unnamed protein product [Timema genevievae]
MVDPRTLGQGRFGKVYTVVNNQTGDLMAMKEIQLQPNDHRTIRRVTEELRIFEGIQHYNLVRYYGVEIHREEMLIFMEFCAEGTLESLVVATENGLPEALIRRYTLQMLLGVSELHNHGIVHRDIKSANIFLTDEGNGLKLGDFGSAAKIKAHTTMVGELQGFVGTQANRLGQKMFKESLLENVIERHDSQADVVCVRLSGATANLHVADACYHKDNYKTVTNARNIIQSHISKLTGATTLGLAVKLNHRFGSKELVSLIHDYGYFSTYDKVLKFKKSAAKYIGEQEFILRGLEANNCKISAWFDNYDLQIFTPNAYMAPEVFMKTNTEGHGRAADVWSVGCVVIEMASGKRPWSEYDSNYQVMFKVGMGESPAVPDSLSEEGEQFLELCLQHDPRNRGTANELLHHNFVKVYGLYSAEESPFITPGCSSSETRCFQPWDF